MKARRKVLTKEPEGETFVKLVVAVIKLAKIVTVFSS